MTATTGLPRLVPFDGGAHLLVDDVPFLMVGGQVHNSSSSERRHFAEVLDRMSALNCNTVWAPVSWAQIEPVEGELDLSIVDAMLEEAGRRHLRIVLLWFGAFKNAASTYGPTWVRADRERFPRAMLAPDSAEHPLNRKSTPVLSVFNDDLLEADRRAFVALMQHLAQHDRQHTVVMVQVENEIGLLGSSRDHAPIAEAAWQSAVPQEVSELYGWPQGTWSQAPDGSVRATEAFMAWRFASYCEALAKAGRAAKDLPMYVNAWLGPQPGQDEPGEYPSGGPTAGVIDLYRLCAPSIDFCSPDIYVDDFVTTMAQYHRDGNPLFVPESAVHAGRPLQALGHHRALGFSFFGIDDIRTDGQVALTYTALAAVRDELAAAQARGAVDAVVLRSADAQSTIELGDVQIRVRNARTVLNQILLDVGVPVPPPAPEPPLESEPGARPSFGTNDPFGLFIRRDDGSLLVLGQGLDLEFFTDGQDLEVDEVLEWHAEDGQLRAGRVLNGDERLELIPMDSIGLSTIRLMPPPRTGSPVPKAR